MLGGGAPKNPVGPFSFSEHGGGATLNGAMGSFWSLFSFESTPRMNARGTLGGGLFNQTRGGGHHPKNYISKVHTLYRCSTKNE